MPGSVASPKGVRRGGDGRTTASARRSSSQSSDATLGRDRQSSGSGSSSVSRRRPRRAPGHTPKHYAAHVCRYPPYRPPSAIMLDPCPSLRIHSLCVVGLATLATVHRTGVRLYRERQLSATTLGTAAAASPLSMFASRLSTSAAAAASAGTGIFGLTETRHDFHVRESYLCAAMQPVLVDDGVLLSKWSRYFSVASGNDRVVHSVSVMSSGAHFCLNHTQHEANKVVCMQCTQLALEPFHPLSLKPAVVSVDEVGTVVLFDVEREAAAVLEQVPLWYRQTKAQAGCPAAASPSPPAAAAEGDGLARVPVGAGGHHHQTPLLQQRLTAEEEERVLDTMEKASAAGRVVYHLEHGVATRVVLVGPCLELCNRCHNAFSRPSTSARGYRLVSVYICSRARDVPDDVAAGNDPAANGAAELNVVLLRVLWGPRRAFVLEETRLVQEIGPRDVCDAGVAMSARPYQVGLPMTLLLARPALALWRLSGCTGEALETRRLCSAAALDGRGGPRCSVARRAASEFFLHWVPLGRHRLVVDRGGGEAEEQTWFCTAAVTDDDTVLLLGSVPQSLGHRTQRPAVTAAEPVAAVDAAASAAAPSASPPPAPPPVLPETKATPEPFRDTDLEAWLDEVSAPASRPPSPEAADGAASVSAAEIADAAEVAVKPLRGGDGLGADGGVAVNDGHVTVAPYTVLMELYSPHRSVAKAGGVGGGASAPATGVLAVLPDWTATRLLLFLADQESLVSVPLPFREPVSTVMDTAQRGVQRSDGGEHTAASAADGDGASPAARDGAVVEAQDGGVTHSLWGSTSRAVSAASQGWSASVQRWTPSAASYLSYFDTSGSAKTATASPEPPSTKAPQSTTATAAGGARETQPAFSFTRPLMAAMFHLAGGDDAPPPPPPPPRAQPPTATTPVPQKTAAAADTGPLSAPPMAAAAVTGAACSTPPPPPCPSPLAASSTGRRSGSAASTAATTVTSAVPIHVASHAGVTTAAGTASECGSSGQRRRHHHSRRRSSSCESSVAGSTRTHRTRRLPHVLSVALDNAGGAASSAVGVEDAGAVQAASYVSAQMALLHAETVSVAGSSLATPRKSSPAPQYAPRRLLDVEEPLQRHALVYAWRDGHDDLYVRFAAGQDEIREREEAEQDEDRQAHTSSAKSDTTSTSPNASRRGRRVHRPGLVLCRPAEVERGVQSMGFFSQYHAAVAARRSAGGSGGFDFGHYFQTLQVPQHLLDVQERDKCWLELEDLRLQQAKDLASLRPYSMVEVFQNEERAITTAEAGWRLHATFPYDDAQSGHVVDLLQLNRTAGSSLCVAVPEWRWASAAEAAAAWAEDDAHAHGGARRVRSLVKELKDWDVGPWAYAARWPSKAEEQQRGGRGFSWSAAAAPEHTCRRRRLTRWRVCIETLKRHTELTAAHQQELAALRAELGL